MVDEAHNPLEGALPAPRRYVWKTVALSTVLVLCGMFIGSGLTLMAINRRVDEFRARPELVSERMVERMQADLELTEKQTEEIRKIFGDARRDAGQMRERNRAQAQAFFRDFQGKVSQVLTPSQQAEWEEWFRKARGRAIRDRHEDKHDRREPRGAPDDRFRHDGTTSPPERELHRSGDGPPPPDPTPVPEGGDPRPN